MLEYEFNGIGKTIMALRKLSRDFNDEIVKMSLHDAAAIQRQRTAKLFLQGGEPAWEDISYHTRKRRKMNRDGLPMTETSSLRESVASKDSAGNEGTIYDMTKVGDSYSLLVGSKENRALALQEPRRFIKDRDFTGKWNGEWKAMPARPFLYFEESTVRLIQQDGQENLARELRKRFTIYD